MMIVSFLSHHKSHEKISHANSERESTASGQLT